MIETFWIALILLVVGALLVAVTSMIKKKKVTRIDYYALFWMGIIWIIGGIPLNNYLLITLGLVSLIISLLHKAEWGQQNVKWTDLGKTEKIIRGIVMSVLVILLIMSIFFYFLV
jgi:hypothetical protein